MDISKENEMSQGCLENKAFFENFGKEVDKKIVERLKKEINVSQTGKDEKLFKPVQDKLVTTIIGDERYWLTWDMAWRLSKDMGETWTTLSDSEAERVVPKEIRVFADTVDPDECAANINGVKFRLVTDMYQTGKKVEKWEHCDDGKTWLRYLVPDKSSIRARRTELPKSEGKPCEKILNAQIEFRKVCDEMLDLHRKKDHDYAVNEDLGTSFQTIYNLMGLSYPVARILEKALRLVALSKEGVTASVKDETMEDSLKDLANYCIMTIVEERMAMKEYNGSIKAGR